MSEEISDTAPEIIREVYRNSLPFVLGGAVVGLGIGGALGYFLTRHRLETKYNQIAEDEINEMRQHYRDKTVALENTVSKPQLDDVVRDQGYSTTEPPMAVTAPESMVSQEDIDEIEEDDEEGEIPEDEQELIDETLEEHDIRMESRNVFENANVDDDWDYHKELAGRSPIRPYVVHIDEKDEYEYDSVTYSYYEADDVLCNERNEVVDPTLRDALVGEANLEKFGHGSRDPHIVYVRNDKLEMLIEITLSHNKFAEEVHGFQHSDIPDRRNRKRFFDDE